jgi:uncharacterized protein (UPF0248 family)
MHDENTIKFYHYFFEGVEKPIIMEAESKSVADAMLEEFGRRIGDEIPYHRLVDVRIEMPITGISKRTRGGENFIWVGPKHSSDGWMLEAEFERATQHERRNKS